jgi:hypothetical protein
VEDPTSNNNNNKKTKSSKSPQRLKVNPIVRPCKSKKSKLYNPKYNGAEQIFLFQKGEMEE